MPSSFRLTPSPRENGCAALVVVVIAVLPIAHSAEAPLAIAAILGLVFAWRGRHDLLADRSVRLAVVLFACYWLPALVSVPDSVAPAKSWSTARDLLRFLPYALFVCLALRSATLWPRIISAVGAIVALWLIDAWVQAFTGFSIAGAAEKERLSGIFGAGNLKLGPVLAVLAPFVFGAARDAFGRRGILFAFVFMLVPILLAGSRAAWLMYTLVVAAVAWRETHSPLRFLGWSAAAACMGVLVALIALHDSRAFEARVDRSLLVLHGSEQAVDEASAGRLRIWGTALRMSAAHPFNGVGVRAFRFAYPRYSGANDSFVAPDGDQGAAHAHQIVLEVASETGGIGLLLWLAGAVVALRAWRRGSAAARQRAWAPALALAVMTFPLNTHLAFYSAWWGLLFWWLLALFCAALNTKEVVAVENANYAILQREKGAVDGT